MHLPAFRRVSVVLLACLMAPAFAHAQASNPFAGPQLRAALPDGRHINLVCEGQGAPAVILSAGAGDWSVTWSKVMPLVARTTRVCAWDRPGYGFSDASAQTQSAANLAGDLKAALKAARIAPPYVLAAHSAGGFETLQFAADDRADVAGLVLVDPTIPGLFAHLRAVSPLAAMALRTDTANRVAAFRQCAADPAQPAPAAAAICFRVPENARALAGDTARDHDAARLATRASLYEQFEANAASMARPDLGDVPLTILTSENEPLLVLPVEQPARKAGLETIWNDGHDALAKLSRRGSNRTVPGTSHPIQQEKPEAVAEAIVTMVTGLRAP